MQAGSTVFPNPATSLSGAQFLGSISLDSKGVIRFCSESLARLIGSSKASIIGQSIRSLIPDLPFRPTTEGYNVAYARFSSARRERQSWSLKRCNGDVLRLFGNFVIVKLQTGFALRLDLQCPATDSNEMTASVAGKHHAARSRASFHGQYFFREEKHHSHGEKSSSTDLAAP